MSPEVTSRVVSHEMRAAMHAWASFTDAERAAAVRAINQLQTIRREIAERASQLGYDKLCRRSIPSCEGECCTLLFPRRISNVDFFVACHGMSIEEGESLSRKLEQREDRGNRCPLLAVDGCLLTFEQRPISCANAYPCFASHSYWEFLQEKRPETEAIYAQLKSMLDSGVSAGANHPQRPPGS